MNQPVFISYRRETGHQLANLVASELQWRGYTTFLDVQHTIYHSDQIAMILSMLRSTAVTD